MLDVGTNNQELRNDPLYLGINQPRLQGDGYNTLVKEFIEAVQDAFPRALIQFEDFLTPNAYALLKTWRHQTLCFNDDIQGTAGVTIAALHSAIHLAGNELKEQKIAILGGGSAGMGIAEYLKLELMDEGLSEEEAVKHVATRIRRVQDILERRIAIENVSYYFKQLIFTCNISEL